MPLCVCLIHLNLGMFELNVQTLWPQACRIDVGRCSLTWRPLLAWSNWKTSNERGNSRCSQIDTNRPPWRPSWRLLLSRGWRGYTRRMRSAWTSCWASGWRSEVTRSTAGRTSSGNKFHALVHLFICNDSIMVFIYLFIHFIYLFIYFYLIYIAKLSWELNDWKRTKSLYLSVSGRDKHAPVLWIEYKWNLNTHNKNSIFNLLFFSFEHNIWLNSASLQNMQSVSLLFILNSHKPGPGPKAGFSIGCDL